MNNIILESLSDAEKIEKRSSLRYLRERFIQFKSIYDSYNQRLSHGYFSLFCILQFIINTSYVFVLSFKHNSNSLLDITPDLVLCSATAIIFFAALFILNENRISRNHRYNILFICSILSYLIIYLIDTALPLYHYISQDEYYRTPFTAHLVIACYIFFTLSSYKVSIAAAVFATASHIIVSGVIAAGSNDNGKQLIQRLFIDLIYFACINGLGLYLRYVNELTSRQNFLDCQEATQMKIKVDSELQERENLLSTILPIQITSKLLEDKVLQNFLEQQPRQENLRRNVYSFKKNLLFRHENVSILYADIVNYTELTSRIKVMKLVETLNELFGNFDNKSEELKVIRIKFLGDCYYCVSNLQSYKNEEHADSCVELGLSMVETIKEVSEKCKVDLNMRIGIHTGNIYTGIIGLTKWQMDIWSKDVVIANKMESTGFPGKVHITEQTRVQLRKQYNIAETNATQRDDFLIKENLKSYVISPDPMKETFIDVFQVAKTTNSNKPGVGFLKRKTPRMSRLSSDQMPQMIMSILKSDAEENKTIPRPSLNTRRSANVRHEVRKFQALGKSTDETIEKDINEMPLSKYAQWFQVDYINPAFLVFNKWNLERSYILLPDTLFRFYLSSATIVLLCFIIIRFISIQRWENTTLLSIITLIVLMVVTPILWLTKKVNESTNDEDNAIELGAKTEPSKENNLDERVESPSNVNLILNTFYVISAKIVDNVLLRVILYVLLCCILTGCIVTELTHCDYDIVAFTNDQTIAEGCFLPWNITETIALSLIMGFVFLKMHLWLKFVYSAVITVVYSYWVWYHAYNYFMQVDMFNSILPPPIAHILCTVYFAVILHVIDRQSDYMYRLNHKWNQNVLAATEEAKKLRESNQRLLANVMPLEIAEKYYNQKNFYCEYYNSVAVMFASIIDVDPPDEESNFEDLLTVFNEIISDFDLIICSKTYRNKIEKIKLANRTYVACAGLTPGRVDRSSTGQNDDELHNEDAQLGLRLKGKYDADDNLLVLLNFAVDIRKALIKHNREANSNYALRIGICDGSLTAGVVGSKKPHYDIWGDCVNMASRMDTTGKPWCIQVWESTEMVLRRNRIQCDYNQFIFVKGKSDIATFNVKLNDTDDLVIIDENEDYDDEDDDDF